MRSAMMVARPIALLMLMTAGSGCEKGTYLVVTLDGMFAASRTSVAIALTSNGQMGSVDPISAADSPINLPMSVSIKMPDDRRGMLHVAATASGPQAVSEMVEDDVDLVPGEVTRLRLRFGSGLVGADLGAPDGAPDLSPHKKTLQLSAMSYPVGRGPQALVLADWNNDGRLDVATANRGSGTISVQIGVGNGMLGPAITALAATEPTSIAAGDFDQNGKLDLVVGLYQAPGLAVLLGNGDGTFLSAKGYKSTPAIFGIAIFDASSVPS